MLPAPRCGWEWDGKVIVWMWLKKGVVEERRYWRKVLLKKGGGIEISLLSDNARSTRMLCSHLSGTRLLEPVSNQRVVRLLCVPDVQCALKP